jgi:hypothetical protein
VAGPPATAALGSVRPRRAEAWDTQVRTGRAWALANDAMVRPLEMLRPGPRTVSVAHRRPAVSITIAPDGSATRKLLS